MATIYVNDDEHVIRCVKHIQLRTDDDENVVGIMPAAFSLREIDMGKLSVSWCEYFGGSKAEQTRCAIEATKSGFQKPGKSWRYATLSVRKVKDIFSNNRTGINLRFIHDPVDGNPAHVSIHNWPEDDMELFDLIAADCWASCLTTPDADTLPVSACEKGPRAP